MEAAGAREREREREKWWFEARRMGKSVCERGVRGINAEGMVV